MFQRHYPFAGRYFSRLRSGMNPVLALFLWTLCHADGPADNIASRVRPIPPPGIAIVDTDRQALEEKAALLASQIGILRKTLAGKAELLELLPDIEIYHKAVDWALRYNEFYRTNELTLAQEQLKEGFARAAALQNGQAPWTTATGLVVRGYRSRIDQSIQPYGLVVPAGYSRVSGHPYRLDCWFHGRGEQLTELAFIADRSRNPGEFTPPNALVLHLYGRYCNGSRFAGETDFWEALEETQRQYSIDSNRIVVRGFSLGGAACWHITTHHAAKWAAAAPGAGFSETAEFLRVFQQEDVRPPWWEQKLWRMYDSTSYALNTAMVPLVAYSGEIDGQRQAAVAMEKAMAVEGLNLTHLVGPQTGHRYEPVTKAELNRRIDRLTEEGRVRVPAEVVFTTHTLRYHQMAWVTIDEMQEHWEPALVHASIQKESNQIVVTTTNVIALSLKFEAGETSFQIARSVAVSINGQIVEGTVPGSDRSWQIHLVQQEGNWKIGVLPRGLRKRHGLQGPIDDAFFDSFLMVKPSGHPLNSQLGSWVTSEADHAVEQWRREFRGVARQRLDVEITEADIRENNLVLWGDPASNRVLAKIAAQLPFHWTESGVVVGNTTYPSDTHVPVLVFPNPLNPDRYVVINSGFTFREYDYLNNARQTPKLPDWAVVDIRTPADSRSPGKIADAGFFNESWELKNH